MHDKIYMKRALKIAQYGRFTTHPNPNVGCVIVNKDNQIVGEGFHYRAGEPHAEINALRMAGEEARKSTVYLTLEPCNHYGKTPSCCDALIKAGVSRVVEAMQDPNPMVNGKSFHRLQQEGIEIINGFMNKEAESINKGFIKRMRTGFPYIQLKFGASLDGKTSMLNGESKWITSLQSRRDVQYLRAHSHAILTSSETVVVDDPLLTVRWSELNAETQAFYHEKDIRQPLRIIIDSCNRVTLNHRIMKEPGEIWLIRIHADNKKWPINVRQLIIPENNGYIDLKVLMKKLGEYEINSIWVEAGPKLAGAFIQANLVDELIVYLAPKLLGNDSRGLCVLPNLKDLYHVPEFTFSKVRSVGPDLCLHLINK